MILLILGKYLKRNELILSVFPSDVVEYRSSSMLYQTVNSIKKIQLKIVICSTSLVSAFSEQDAESI